MFVLQLCEICQEPFETYWVEEEEDWFLKNAVGVDDKVKHAAEMLNNVTLNMNHGCDSLN